MKPKFDFTSATLGSRPKDLSIFMTSTSEHSQLWKPEDLAAIYRHQLAAPLFIGFDGGGSRTALRLTDLKVAPRFLEGSLSALFQHPHPPRELLEIVKDFAKSASRHPDRGLPEEVAIPLYYTSIAVAIVRLKCRISTLSDAKLQRGFSAVLATPWIDKPTKDIVSAAAQMLPELKAYSV